MTNTKLKKRKDVVNNSHRSPVKGLMTLLKLDFSSGTLEMKTTSLPYGVEVKSTTL